jgi:hypothetical protein
MRFKAYYIILNAIKSIYVRKTTGVAFLLMGLVVFWTGSPKIKGLRLYQLFDSVQ